MSHSSEGEREGGCWDSNVSHSDEGEGEGGDRRGWVGNKNLVCFN